MMITNLKSKVYIVAIIASLSFAFVLVPQYIQAQTGNLPMPDYCREPKKTELKNEVAKWEKVLNDINQISGTGWVTLNPGALSGQSLSLLREMDNDLEESRQINIDDIRNNPQGWFVVDDFTAWFLETATNEGILRNHTEMDDYGNYSIIVEQVHVENARSAVNYKLVYLKSQLNNCNRWEDQAIIDDPNSTGQERLDAQGRIELGRAQMEEDLRNAKAALEYDTDSVQTHELDDNRCFYKWGIHPWNCVLDLTTAISNLLVKIFGSLLWATGALLDLSIFISITKFKAFVIDNPGFDHAWKIMRDLANLSFIFILLYIAIGTIFDLSIGNRGKKLIVDVIIVALLVNFSGFFVRVVVDASNVVAYEFYSRMSYDQKKNDTIILPQNIGTALAAKLHIEANMIRPTTTEEGIANLDDSVKMDISQPKRMGFIQLIVAMLGNILIILSVSFVFLAAAIMFIIRSVVLAIVYIFAPVAFVARLVPSFESTWKKWFNTLLQQSFYAPAFLIPLYAVFLVLGPGLTRLMGSIKSNDQWGFYDGSLTVAVFQGIIIAMVVSCIFIAQKFGAYGSNMAMSYGRKFKGKVISGSKGVASFAATSTIGRTASRLSQSQTMQNLAARSRIAMGTRNALRNVADSGFGTGTKGFEGRQAARRQVQSTRAQNFTGPNAESNRAAYLGRLVRGGDRESLYQNMQPRQRSEVDRELRAQGRGEEANRLVNTLTGREGRQAVANTWREARDNDRLTQVIGMDQNRLSGLYAELNPQERATLRRQLDNIQDPQQRQELIQRFDQAHNEFRNDPRNRRSSGETARQIEIANQAQNFTQFIGGTNNLIDPNDAFNPQSPLNTPEQQQQIRNLRSLDAESLTNLSYNQNLFDGNHRDIYPYLSAEQLRTILSNGLATQVERDHITRAIEHSRGPGPHNDRTIERAYQYLNNPGTTF